MELGDADFLPNLPIKKMRHMAKQKQSMLIPIGAAIVLGVVAATTMLQLFPGEATEEGGGRRNLWNLHRRNPERNSLLQRGQMYMSESFPGSFPRPYSEGMGFSSVQV
jgi:hypothetical protein